ATSVVSSTDSDANDISITAATGNITVGVVNAGTTAGDVTLTATAGAIIDDANDAIVDVTGDVVTLSSAPGVGQTAGNGPLDTAANTLNATVSGAGLINIDEANAVTLNNVTTANGTITLSTIGAGDVTAENVNAGTQNVSITVANGNLVSGAADPGVADIVGNLLTLTLSTAGRNFGVSTANRLEIDATTLTAN